MPFPYCPTLPSLADHKNTDTRLHTINIHRLTSAPVTHPGSFSNYYEPYIASAWSRYASPAVPLTVATQAQWGNVSGNVTAGAGDGVLTFPNNITYTAPSTADVFSCSSGPFAPNSNIEQGAITARLAAACNRSTLLENATTPFSGEDPGAYYRNGVTNHYARIVHQNNLDGRGYAFVSLSFSRNFSQNLFPKVLPEASIEIVKRFIGRSITGDPRR